MLTEQEMLEIAENYMAFSSHDHIELELYYEEVIKKLLSDLKNYSIEISI